MRNIFLEKSYTKYRGETSLRSFSKKAKLSKSLDQYSKVLYNLFLLKVKLRTIVTKLKLTLKLSCRSLAFTSYKVFLENKMRSGISLPASFCDWFLKKNIFLVMFYYLIKFHCLGLPLLREIFGNRCIVTANQFVTSKTWKLTLSL